jgi:hypothetical protein
MEPKRPLSVDGVRRRQAAAISRPSYSGPGSAAVVAHPQVQPKTHQRPFQRASADQTRTGFWQRLQLPLLVAGSMLAGFLVESLVIGLVLISLYGVIAFIQRIPSRVSFMLSFISMITVIVLLVAKPGTPLAGNFATYTFLLLVIGVIALAIEARPPKRRTRSRRSRRG